MQVAVVLASAAAATVDVHKDALGTDARSAGAER
jgi:hypothetical protein